MAGKEVGATISYKSRGAKQAASDARNVGDAMEDFVKKLKRADFSAVTELEKKLRSANFGTASTGLDKTAVAANKAAGSMKLTAQQATQLSYQLNDVAVQLAGGQSPFLVILQQGSQITPLFGGIVSTLTRFGPILLGIGVALTPVIAAFKVLSKIDAGDAAAKSINEAAIAADKAGLSVKQLDGYMAALSGKSVKTEELTSGFNSLSRAAYASRDAFTAATKEYRKKIAETAPSDKYLVDLPKIPDDVFKKLGVDVRNYNGDINGLLTTLQNKFASIKNVLQRNEFKRLVEEAFTRPVAELVQKTPADIAKLNAALDSIAPRISKAQETASAQEQQTADTLAAISKRISDQEGAAFINAAQSYNQAKLQFITDNKDQIDAYISFLQRRSKDIADLFDIIRGDNAAKKSSPLTSDLVDGFKFAGDVIANIFEGFTSIPGAIYTDFQKIGIGFQQMLSVAMRELDLLVSKAYELAAQVTGNAEGVQSQKQKQVAIDINARTRDEELAARLRKITGVSFEQQANEAAQKYGDAAFVVEGFAKAVEGADKSGKKLTGNNDKTLKNNVDSATDSTNKLTQALTQADEAAKLAADSTSAMDRKRDPRLGNNGFGFGKEAQFVNDPKANPDYYRSDAEYAAIAERQRQEAMAAADKARADFVAKGGNTADLGANDQVAQWQAVNGAIGQATQSLGATTQAAAGLTSQTDIAVSSAQRLADAFQVVLDKVEKIGSKPIISPSDSSSGSGSSGGGGGAPFASGGFVSGPGSATSDSIPAWLSHGEYVVRASRVKALGVSLLNSLNGTASIPSIFGRRRFADGGLVSAVPAGSGGGSGNPVYVSIDRGDYIGPMKASGSVVDQLLKEETKRRVSSAGRAPSRVG